jgi:hypothetical protein
MGISAGELDFVGATRFRGHNSSKEADSAYRPHSFKRNRLANESGKSESLDRLRFDARWWLIESGGDVKIVIIISIKRAQSMLRIEKWELAPSGRLL